MRKQSALARWEERTTVPRSEADAADAFGDPEGDLRAGPSAADAARRYDVTHKLGEGGLGEVLLCRDRCLGRDVAMKRIAGSRPVAGTYSARFLREARVQGRLEHPAVVPVHDLGVDERGAPFFTMRRVRGSTLADALDRMRARSGDVTLHQLLAAWVRVALAVHYAHTSGVVHRDLKPENVMLGDFGEVYVLDWGVAKVSGPDEAEVAPLDESGERPVLAAPAGDEALTDGMVGTPAYMAPEQIRGDRVDARTDVYALGAILFEILTLTPLHPEVTASKLRERAERGPDARARDRAPERDVPPELEAACLRATELDPARRYPSARALAEAVERFLSGHRDLATRRELAGLHVAAADRILGDATADGARLAARGHALEELGRAIALDHDNADALDRLRALLRDAPKERPPEVERAIEDTFVASRKVALRRAMALYGLVGPLAFLVGWSIMGVQSWPLALATLASYLVAGFVAWRTYRDGDVTRNFPWISLLAGFAFVLTGVSLGPLVLAPSLVIVNTITHVIVGRREHRFAIMAIGALSLLAPIALELAGVVPSTFAFRDGALVLTSPMVRLGGPATVAFLVVVHVGTTILGAAGLRRYRDALERAEARSIAHAWILEKLVPAKARVASEPPPRRPRAA
ncbi:MAG: protein kinase [Myxococcales bacterium]|nr:protein kinase [Myxococcales bacterium]